MIRQLSTSVVFLISQPRSGSTLLQRMLGSHPLIHTQSESWILLHPLFPMKYEEFAAPYNSWLYSLGLKDFILSLPGGETQYKEAIANMFYEFYRSILQEKNKSLFLDKTPRYFHIINELLEFFPYAKFIFLLRNPIAVILSIINTFTKENWYRLSDFRHDLLFAPTKLLNGIEAAGSKAYTLQYETLLSNPEQELEGICSFLGINFTSAMLHYNNNFPSKWRFGDQHNVYLSAKPDPAFKDKWKQSLNDPQAWKVASEYLHILGKELVLKMGYDFDALANILEANKPLVFSNETTSLNQLLENKTDLIIDNYRLKKQLNDMKRQLKQMSELQDTQKNNLKKSK